MTQLEHEIAGSTMSVQLDNQLLSATQPVVLAPAGVPPSERRDAARRAQASRRGQRGRAAGAAAQAAEGDVNDAGRGPLVKFRLVRSYAGQRCGFGHSCVRSKAA